MSGTRARVHGYHLLLAFRYLPPHSTRSTNHQALKSYKSARIAEPTHTGAYLNAANLQLSLEKYDKAEVIQVLPRS